MTLDGRLLALVQPSLRSRQWKRHPINPISVIDLESGKTRSSVATGLQSRGGIPWYLEFSPDGMLVVGGSEVGDKAMSLVAYSVENGERQFTAEYRGMRVPSEHPNFIVGIDEREQVIWFHVIDLLQQGRIHHLEIGKVTSTSTSDSRASISNNGRFIACLADGESVVIHDLQGGGSGTRIGGHSAKIRAIAISPDGRRVVTSSNGANGAVRKVRVLDGPIVKPAPAEVFVWSIADGKRLLSLEGNTGPIDRVRFSPDGKRILTLGMRTTVWDAISGDVIASTGGKQLGPQIYGVNFTHISRDFAERIDLTNRSEPSKTLEIRHTGL